MRGDEQDDRALLVQAGALVADDRAVHPVRAVPGGIGDGRVQWIDADALNLIVLAEHQADEVLRCGVIQADVQAIAHLRLGGEGEELDPSVHRLVDTLEAAVDPLGEDLGNLHRGDGEIVRRREGGRQPGADAHRRHERSARDDDILRLRDREHEFQAGPGRGGGEHALPEQLEELHVVQVGHPVQPVDELVDEEREGLDERDTGIGHVVVRPLGVAQLHEALGLVDEILEATIVQIRGGKRHGCSSAGMR